MIKWDPNISWDTQLNRILQSWRDRAPHTSRDPFLMNSLVCSRCRLDKYINHAINSDPGIKEEWPHWMQHTLQEDLLALRDFLLAELFDRPHFDATVGYYYRGSGLVQHYEMTEEIASAREIVHDHSKVVDMWLLSRMTAVHPWPARVRKAAKRDFDVSAFYY